MDRNESNFSMPYNEIMSHQYEQAPGTALLATDGSRNLEHEIRHQVEGVYHRPMTIAPTEVRAALRNTIATSNYTSDELFYTQEAIPRYNPKSLRITRDLHSSDFQDQQTSVSEICHSTNMPYLFDALQSIFSRQAEKDDEKPQHSTRYNGLVGETVTVWDGPHDGLVGVVAKLIAQDALVEPYLTGDSITVPLSSLVVGGIVMDVHEVPTAFYSHYQFKSEALPQYVRTHPILIDHHNQIDVILKWLKDFDQGQNVHTLTLTNFAYFPCRTRGTDQASGDITLPPAIFPSYLNDDGSQSNEAQHQGVYDHLDLIDACSNLDTLVLQLDSSAFWEPAGRDDDILAPAIAPSLRNSHQIVKRYDLDTFLRIPTLRVLHIQGLHWMPVYEDPQANEETENTYLQIRGDLIAWLEANKPEQLELSFSTEEDEVEEEGAGVSWRGTSTRRRRNRNFTWQPSGARGRDMETVAGSSQIRKL
ncbi:hypothetical protein FKW77_003500 [Venturia effusa]|uniref:Uncharacterized protein n=1 Tax=Venturia effusa TaxID=50376 RepID=A0A517LAR4_9PEZI|nr:hypothetical protein FKW77_003500 [Venturia effusa]